MAILAFCVERQLTAIGLRTVLAAACSDQCVDLSAQVADVFVISSSYFVTVTHPALGLARRSCCRKPEEEVLNIWPAGCELALVIRLAAAFTRSTSAAGQSGSVSGSCGLLARASLWPAPPCVSFARRLHRYGSDPLPTSARIAALAAVLPLEISGPLFQVPASRFSAKPKSRRDQ